MASNDTTPHEREIQSRFIEKLNESLVRPFNVVITESSAGLRTTTIHPLIPPPPDYHPSPPSHLDVTQLENAWFDTFPKCHEKSSFAWFAYRRLFQDVFPINDCSVDLEFGKLHEFIDFMIDTDCLAPWMNHEFRMQTSAIKDVLLALRDITSEYPEEEEVFNKIFLRDIPNDRWEKFPGIKYARFRNELAELIPAISAFISKYAPPVKMGEA